MQGSDRKFSVPLSLVAVLFVLRVPAGIAGSTEIAIIERFASVLRLGDDMGIAQGTANFPGNLAVGRIGGAPSTA